MDGGSTNKTFDAPTTPDHETFRRKEDVRRHSDYSSEYFDRVFSSGPSYDLYRSLNKHKVEERKDDEGSAQTKNSDSGLSGSKCQGNHNQEEKSFYTTEPVESSCFGSSLNYGGRDFYVTSSSPQAYGKIESYRIDEVEDANVAVRGEWWQGSYHY